MEFDTETLKKIAKEKKIKVKNLLALSPTHDPFYIYDWKKQYAEWTAKVWEKEGSPKIHPRGFHYRILDKGYKLPNGKTYLNTESCWEFIQNGFKYARLFGLIPYSMVLDMKNGQGIEKGNFFNHTGISYNDFYSSIKGYDESDTDEIYIENLIDDLCCNFSIGFNSHVLQPFYIEMWAEKSGIIPEYLAGEFNATIRTAGGGEFSVDMCYQAVQRAKSLNKPLFVFLLSDFDPKGFDMPKSVARKIEFISKKYDVISYVKSLALTLEQCEKFNLPETPAKKPNVKSKGARGYVTHTNNFYKAMNRKTTEINSLMARDEEAYYEEIRQGVAPYFDAEMDAKINELKEEIEEQINDIITDFISKNKDKILETAKQLTAARKELDEFYQKKKEELGIVKLESDFHDLTRIDEYSIIQDLEYELPEPEFEEPTDVILNGNLDYFEQLKLYKELDMRTKNEVKNENS